MSPCTPGPLSRSQDCWQARFRDGDGTLQADPRIFPSGIKTLAQVCHGVAHHTPRDTVSHQDARPRQAIHADGNLFGIYVDQGYRP